MTVVCIAGMHRSGTSMVARMLNLCGLYLGEEKDLMPAAEDNPDGYWENRYFVDINDGVLLSLKGSWDTPPDYWPGWEDSSFLNPYRQEAEEVINKIESLTSLWGWKDPRTSLTLPFWQKLIPDLKVVICVRHPDEVAHSLARRGHSSTAFSARLWYTYYERLLASVQSQNQIITHYDAFFHDAQAELYRLLSFLNVPKDQQKINTAHEALNLTLRHNRATLADLSKFNDYPEVAEMYSRLCAQAGPIFQNSLPEHFGKIKHGLVEQPIRLSDSQLNSTQRVIQSLETQLNSKTQMIQALTAQATAREQRVQVLTAQMTEIYGSKAWQLATLLQRVREFLIPRDSKRAGILKKLIAIPLAIWRDNRIQRGLALLRSSNLFDETWYLEHYPDVVQAGLEPARHYLLYGGFEGRDPGPNFSSKWYLETYSDVLASNMNPLVHYLLHGQKQGRFLPNKIATLTQKSQSNPIFRGGIIFTLSNAWKVYRREGIQGIFYRLRHILRDYFSRDTFSSAADSKSKKADVEYLRTRAFQIVPYYLDPFETPDTSKIQSIPKIAVHLHLFYSDMLEECVKHLNNIPVGFDLYVSTAEENDPNQITEFLRSNINLLKKVVVKKVPNRGRDLAPLIIDFGKDLLNYDFIAHIHTKKSPHDLHLESWFEDIMNTLLGSQAGIYQIFKLLLNDAKFVYPAPNEKILVDESGWGDNYILALNLMPKLLKEKIESYPLVEFPQGSMFWAKSHALSRFLGLPLKYTDFPSEPIPSNGTIVHVLERLLLVAANKVPGRNYRIYLPSSIVKESYYENQKDYSAASIHKTVRVLSYYLPQFYAIPENDEWHGKGFTEWNKVQSANPLFYGHYQQRVPHKDLGYYFLNSPKMLKKQAELMRLSGVHGQIFYHYWFQGKLILEKPAQMLLVDKSIEMPFCFCWANENWTRKWDGNEDEILLEQKYTEQDAIQFINYLIPFFKDERYIKIEERPVLFIYRPASIPNFEVYKASWEKICVENGLRAPFIVAVLTRGAKSPTDYGMDAGCERVLHDWTNGNVKDIKNNLYSYWPIRGSVLDYDEVADYYMSQSSKVDFTYFRSIIPSWDNAPRYGSEAYIIHDSTPKKFQEWLGGLILDAEERLPENRRFVIVNAWNEWSESAVLEPDNRFGYAYLNSIGRALSGIEFQEREYLLQTVPETAQIAISISDRLLNQLAREEIQRQKMLTCIANSTILSLCNIVFEQSQVAQWMPDFLNDTVELKVKETDAKSDYTLYIHDTCYFTPDTIENMLKMALRYDAGVVTPTHLNDRKFTHQPLSERWEVHQTSPYMFLTKNGDKRSTKCCVDAGIFISQHQSSKRISDQSVSTIVRFSQSGNLRLLQNALYSLIAQVGCLVRPILAVQDLTDDALADLDAMLKKMPWDENCYPVIRRYNSTPQNCDLRSLMLNDSLKAVKTKYAAFLDYDDIMFHDAYAWLTGRLRKTGKNASFGLVYSTVFNLSENKIKTRQVVYDYGKNFADFFILNHTPIHGFMLNMPKIDLRQIEFYEDMKYMEDYFLTLQIFTKDDTDWESLEKRKFVGDYCHYEDKVQTLAMVNYDERQLLLATPDYLKCETRIDELRQKILRRKQDARSSES